ncbi:uncharacterized protein LOC112082776 [Eutrema salsugineum]|uniref:uncharacterized protein LOC112082776 n=1 Tax=Eutrema salsugineum TaxID=72664 RepID=UPI000CED0558|nr:uncharacterized protein LOC112082776 [Eutrema salsugineum]
MAGFAFKFIASCNRARGRYHRTIRAAATKIRNAQSAGQRAVEERDAAIARRKSAEEKWQVEKRRAVQLEEGVKTLIDKIEELKLENQDLISNLQTVNEAKIQAEKSVASEVARVKRHAEVELRVEHEATVRDCELKLEGLRLADLQEGDLPPPFPVTPDGGSDHDNAEDQENREDGTQPDHEGGNQPEE